MKRILAIIPLVLLTLGVPTFAQKSNLQQAKVISIIDGDTLDVQFDKAIKRVRLTCIDTPERGEKPFYKDAKDRLRELAPVGSNISLRIAEQGTDRYKRLVGEIYRNGKSINLQMVREGKAIIYCEYFYNCAGSKTSYLNAEKAAQKDNLGIWNSKNPWKKATRKKPCD
jgi:micrococcal nuclease